MPKRKVYRNKTLKSSEKRFLCDRMLLKLCRYLRFLGYDCKMVDESEKDSEILKRSIKEERILLTRDKRFFEEFSKKYENVIVLNSDDVKEQIVEVYRFLKINLYPIPFRCSCCNEILIEVDRSFVKNSVPKGVLENHRRFFYCKKCKRVYWLGSHWKNIESFFEEVRKLVKEYK